jgi:hypothetical protein
MAYRVSITKVLLTYYEVDVPDDEAMFASEADEFAREEVETNPAKYQLSNTDIALIVTNARRI